ncbi:coiled-coil protein [Legionella birminghamensis]|uniref:Coiled-coil protein n=1 Tax=Legionella birminghamensis TaxID=28083 RepID=A0A378I6G7_9GAMM|nr:LbtU family siderophore porin [Legionella birminghamensis]KTC72471.1 coiled-coil protein [Legionella birminghamensis]STX30603.1 coiled-coil protein [Legionella birminghamensis]
MKHKALIIALAAVSVPVIAADNEQLQQQILQLQRQTQELQNQLSQLQKQLVAQSSLNKNTVQRAKSGNTKSVVKPVRLTRKPPQTAQQTAPAPVTKSAQTGASTTYRFHSAPLSIHTPEGHPESIGFYPTALLADNQVVTYIAGTPVVTSPYLGDRPAFDGSDYIVNISSINRDIRLMQQRRRLYDAYQRIGYPVPNTPIIALSGKAEPVASFSQPYVGQSSGDLTLGSSELDVAAALNSYVEAFIGIAYDESPPDVGGQRLANSAFGLNLGFVNIGNLDESPFYFTAGQLYAPFGRYSSSMISSPITQSITRTKTRPFILGYKSQTDTGPFAAVYGFKSDTTLGHSAVGGVNLGYIFKHGDASGEVGGGLIGSIADAQGLQSTGSAPLTTFGGFASPTNGNEAVSKRQGLNIHGNVSFDRYSLTAEWVGASRAFRTQDLSFNGYGAKPQGAQLEGAVTFMAFDKPASVALGYQWSQETLALNLPKSRIAGVFNISIWKDTVESLEYRHDKDFPVSDFANGAAAPGLSNSNTIGTGKSADSVIAQIGVYF